MHIDQLEMSELWDISRRLIAFDTVSSNSNVAACEYLAQLLEDMGFHVKLFRETVENVPKATVLAWSGPAVADGLIISGHTDIVPFTGQPGWRSDPLQMYHDEQHIYGRGVSDMKVFLAQAILAARQHPLHTLQRPLLFIFTCDEEVAGQGSGRLVRVLPDLLPDFPLPKVALIGEPTNFEIFPAHKGFAVFDVYIQGKGGHSSLPHKGVNAIGKMAEVIAELQEIDQYLQHHVSDENKRLFPEYPASSVNYGMINGGLAPNMIADDCRLTVSFRIAPGDDIGDILKSLRQKVDERLLPAMRAVSPECSISIENLIAVPPMNSPAHNAFSALISQVMGKSISRGVAFATDGGQFQALNIDSYICGPGLIEQAHQPNESLPIENFLNGQEKLSQIIHAWCVQPA